MNELIELGKWREVVKRARDALRNCENNDDADVIAEDLTELLWAARPIMGLPEELAGGGVIPLSDYEDLMMVGRHSTETLIARAKADPHLKDFFRGDDHPWDCIEAAVLRVVFREDDDNEEFPWWVELADPTDPLGIEVTWIRG